MTCENYNCTDANSVEREQERTLTVKNLDHVNYDPDKSDRNVVLEHDSRADQFKTFRAYVKDYKEQEHITGRFNVDTTSDRNATKVLSCFVMSGSHNLMASMTREECFLASIFPHFRRYDSL